MDLLHITWSNPDSDWPYFWLLETKGEWLKLKGADYPDGRAKHDGNVFLAHRNDMKSVLVIEQSIDLPSD